MSSVRFTQCISAGFCRCRVTITFCIVLACSDFRTVSCDLQFKRSCTTGVWHSFAGPVPGIFLLLNSAELADLSTCYTVSLCYGTF